MFNKGWHELAERFAKLAYSTEYPEGHLRPTDEVFQAAWDSLKGMLTIDSSIPRPRVFPTYDGGLQAEWTFMSDDKLYAWAADIAYEPDGSMVAGASSSLGESLSLPPDTYHPKQLRDWVVSIMGKVADYE